jgi:Flp pilus assembly protein TadB
MRIRLRPLRARGGLAFTERSGRGMEPKADARREAALEIQKLAETFEKEDKAAFLRTRIGCWGVGAFATLVIIGMMLLGGDARYLGVLWLIIVGLIWAGYALSSRRQRQQTDRLRALATRWLSAGPTAENAAAHVGQSRSPDRGQQSLPTPDSG